MHHITQGDLGPPVRATLKKETDSGFEPYSLTNDAHDASIRYVTFAFWDRNRNTIAKSRADIVNRENGVVEYEWNRGDTDEDGKFYGLFTVHHTGGKSVSFPNDGPFTIHIRPDPSDTR